MKLYLVIMKDMCQYLFINIYLNLINNRMLQILHRYHAGSSGHSSFKFLDHPPPEVQQSSPGPHIQPPYVEQERTIMNYDR